MMTAMGYFFFWLSIIAAVVIPFVYIDAVEAIKNGGNTLGNKIIIGICSGVIMWTVLMTILT